MTLPVLLVFSGMNDEHRVVAIGRDVLDYTLVEYTLYKVPVNGA
jgi:hypothetical protein